MLSLANVFFDEYELHKRLVKNKDNLRSLREGFIETFFKDIDKRNPSMSMLAEKLNQYPFTEYPTLQQLYLFLMGLQPNLPEIDFNRELKFKKLFFQINQEYGYFSSHVRELCYLFERLLDACQKLILFIEKTDVHEAPLYAYKMMVVFCDVECSKSLRFSFVSNQILHFLKHYPSKTPYHDVWVTLLHELPPLSLLGDFVGWKNLLKQTGVHALFYFVEAVNLERLNGGSAPKFLEIAKALLEKHKYKRAGEDTVFAEICRKKVISEEIFNLGLDFIQKGWPRKLTDEIPNIRIVTEDENFIWLKLPPQDKRALILGRYIPGCCQFIGGASSFCVTQGIAFSNSGFYVLLKQKNEARDAEPLIDNQVNELDFEIVAQSYVWLSNKGNLCFDSIERDSSKVSNDLIWQILIDFSDAVYLVRPDIKHINVGMGGQTPSGIFPVAMRHEKIKQGLQYRDSIDQYCVSNQMPAVVRAQMNVMLASYPERVQEAVHFIIPYFSLEDQYLSPMYAERLAQQIKPEKFNYLLSQKQLKLNDFTPISLETYVSLPPHQQEQVTTIQKLLNAETDEMVLEWMLTIPVEDYDEIINFKLLNQDSYLFRFLHCNNAHLLVNIISRLESNKQREYLESTMLFSVENLLNRIRDLKKYSLFINLIGLYSTKERFLVFRKYMYSDFLMNFLVDENIDLIHELVAMVSQEHRVALLKMIIQSGCLYHRLGILFETSARQLNVEQIIDFLTLNLYYLKNIPVWRICYKYKENFKNILCALTEEERHLVLEKIGIFNHIIANKKYDYMLRLLSIMSIDQQFEYLHDKKYIVYFLQANLLPELEEMIIRFPEELLKKMKIMQVFLKRVHYLRDALQNYSLDDKNIDNLFHQYQIGDLDMKGLTSKLLRAFYQMAPELKANSQSTYTFFKNDKLLMTYLTQLELFSEEYFDQQRHDFYLGCR